VGIGSKNEAGYWMRGCWIFVQRFPYRLLRDLRRGWRYNNPNLDQLGLLEIRYRDLDIFCADASIFSVNIFLAKLTPAQRTHLYELLFNTLRGHLCLESRYLDPVEQDKARTSAYSWLNERWAFAPDEKLDVGRYLILGKRPEYKGKPRTDLVPGGPRSRLLRNIKTAPFWRDSACANEVEHWKDAEWIDLIETLLESAKNFGYVQRHPIDAKLAGWRLNAAALDWRLITGQPQADGPSANPYFRALYLSIADLLRRPSHPLFDFEAQEHTAQVDAPRRQLLEQRFRFTDKDRQDWKSNPAHEAPLERLPVMFCSPTMELGVDISALNTVYLRNVPPTPANYAQRSGRAGRSGQQALVITYCAALSPHDQWFFHHASEMVHGVVRAPTLDLSNRDLIDSHLQAVWLANTQVQLDDSIAPMLDLDQSGKPLQPSLQEALCAPAVRQRALASAQRVIDQLASELDGSRWFTQDYVRHVIDNAAQAFSGALQRWRVLFDATRQQMDMADHIVKSHTASHTERQNAQRRYADAARQYAVLLKSGNSQNNDFYTYRYLASQGFLPGYNFPRLPLMAWIPARGGQSASGKDDEGSMVTCASSGAGKQLRFELLQRLAKDAQRHLILLTATPHSGDEAAFYNLLSLLDPRFVALQGHMTASDPLRQELARHFVQRRRKDIAEWQAETDDGRGFPRRMKTELTYQLSGEWGAFFDAVQSYCRELAETIEQREQQGGARLIWYATLALLRCVASSPAAAVKALTTRLEVSLLDDAMLGDDRLHDGETDDLSVSDLEPPAQLQDASRLQTLIDDAKRLSGKAGDPKLAALIQHIAALVNDGYRPVVFCRYVATAHYVAEHLKTAFPKATVEAVTGELTPEERRERVDDMAEGDPRILVATDCLSEGINLQHLFTAVVHYDLAWNPTRHEQREGRVDRFGQKADDVRCTMLYGQDNPVDGFVLNVILRKGEAIQKELGVLVPLPEDEARINQALVKAALMRREDHARAEPQQQLLFDFSESEHILAPLQAQWRDALEKAKANRTVFAQRRIRPGEVLPEWHKQQQALGTQADVQRFLQSACVRLGSPLEAGHKQTKRFLPQHLPETLRLRLADEGIAAPLVIDFSELHRSHPLVGLLAEYLLEDALSGKAPQAARCAATLTEDVEVVTTLYLLRLRHQLSHVRRREPFQMMAEETVTLAVQGRTQPRWLADDATARLLECTPSGNLPADAVRREVRTALDFLAPHQQQLETLARQRADALLADHERVREAIDRREPGKYSASPCLPVDVIGVYVLLPASL
jgi:superfamily II DNA/RNA helicase